MRIYLSFVNNKTIFYFTNVSSTTPRRTFFLFCKPFQVLSYSLHDIKAQVNVPQFTSTETTVYPQG
jgi:hypothetical protein